MLGGEQQSVLRASGFRKGRVAVEGAEARFSSVPSPKIISHNFVVLAANQYGTDRKLGYESKTKGWSVLSEWR